MSNHKPLTPPQIYPQLNQQVPTPVFPTPAVNYKKARLDLEQFDNMIVQQGVRVQIYKTAFCPNVLSVDGGEHAINCTVCLGNGFIDRDPIETFALVGHASKETKFLSEGYFENEEINLTAPSGIELTYFTLIKLMDQTEQFTQLVKKQDGLYDILKYQCRKVNLCVDANGRVYIPGIHFTINGDGNIQWNPGKGPAPETIYTINYDIAIQFRAINAVHAYRFVQVRDGEGMTKIVKAPQKWKIIREYLVERQGFKKNKLPQNKIRASDPVNYITNPE